MLLAVLILAAVANALENDNIDRSACLNPEFYSGTQNISIKVGKIDRLFELYTPWETSGKCGLTHQCTGPPRDRRGLVMNWHGCNAHAPILDYHTEISQVTEEAKNRGMFAITPLGTRTVSGSFGWNADGIPCGYRGVNDFDFFLSIMDFVNTKLCVDDKKIYTVGFSTGGFLANGLACRYPNMIAAAGTDAGGLSRTELKQCRTGEPVPIQSFHSLDDPTVPYNGTFLWAGQLEVDQMWRDRNGCDDSITPITTFNTSTTVCQKWACPGAPVEACTLSGGMDHCWYGGRSGGFPVCIKRETDVHATKHMFDFWESL